MDTYSVTYQNPYLEEPLTEEVEADSWDSGKDFVWFRRLRNGPHNGTEVVFAVSTDWVGLIRRVENGDANGAPGDPSA